MPLEIYDLFKGGSLDKDLDRLTSPLVEGRIDAAEIEARSIDGQVLRERITTEERPYHVLKAETWRSRLPAKHGSPHALTL